MVYENVIYPDLEKATSHIYMKTKSIDKLSAWLLKQGYPTRPVEWCITPVTGGNIAQDAWQILGDEEGAGFQLPLREEDIDYLPSGMKLSFRLVEGKTICHAIFHFNNTRIRAAQAKQAKVESDNSNVQSGQAMIPPEIVQLRKELDEDRLQLEKKMERNAQWETQLYKMEDELRKASIATISINSKLDERTGKIASNLKEWEQHLIEMNDRDSQHVQELSEMADSKNALAEKNVIAAQIGHVFDKIAAVIQLRQVKKWEDAKPSDIADYQQFLVDRADRRFFSNHPDPVVLLGDSFTRMPKEHMEMFARDIIKWVVYNHPGMFNEVSQEIKEEQQQVSKENE